MTIATPHGEVVVRALVSPRQAKGSVFAPMHWNDQFAAKARVDALVPAITDPVSGQPASKHVAARVARFEVARYGFAVLRNRPERLDADYWAIAPANGGWRVELAFTDGERDWDALAHALFGVREDGGVLYRTPTRGGRLNFVSPASGAWIALTGASSSRPSRFAVSRNWAVDQLGVNFSERTSTFCGRRGSPGGRAGAGGQGGDRLFLLRRRRQADRGRRRRRLRHRRRDRPGLASRHELRIMPLRDPRDH